MGRRQYLWVLLVLIAGASGPLFGQAVVKDSRAASVEAEISIVPGALIRPFVFDPDLTKSRPTPLYMSKSLEQPSTVPVFFVEIAPGLKHGRMQTHHKTMRLKIKRQLVPVRRVRPADAFGEASVLPLN
jgi:hypothetical protein